MSILSRIKKSWKDWLRGPDLELRHKALILRGGVTKAEVDKEGVDVIKKEDET